MGRRGRAAAASWTGEAFLPPPRRPGLSAHPPACPPARPRLQPASLPGARLNLSGEPPTPTPGRVRAPGEVAAGSALTPLPEVLVDLGGGKGGGYASAAGFATAPLPHACLGCDIAAATKEEVEVAATVVAEQVAHALHGKPATRRGKQKS